MGEKKVTVMILKVDLKCKRCCKRVKKLLCKFPEIRDCLFDQKSNTVMIKVISCDPEKIRHKLCHKGRGSIKSIEIRQPQDHYQPAEPPMPKEAGPPPPEPAPKTPELAPNPPKPAPKAPEPGSIPSEPTQEPSKPAPKPPEPAQKPIDPKPLPVEPLSLFGSEPMPTCCEQCYGGRAGGPCEFGYGPPPVYFEGYLTGRMGYNGYVPNRFCHPGRCAEFFSEENPTGCVIM